MIVLLYTPALNEPLDGDIYRSPSSKPTTATGAQTDDYDGANKRPRIEE